MTPPNAEVGSHSLASRCASAMSAPTAMPHGLACLMIATAGSVEVPGGPARGVGVDVVVVGHLLAAQLLGAGQPARAVGVQRGGLVGVLAVPQVGDLGERRPAELREAGARRRAARAHSPIQVGDRDVVRRGVGEGLGGQPLALLEGETAGGHRRQHVVVGRRRGHDGDRRVVLRCRADHGRPADVDLLDALVGGRAGRHGLAEGVQVGDHEVERLDAELRELLDMGLEAAVGEDAGMHLGVQRLDAAVETLGEPGQVLDLGDRDAERLDPGGRAAGRHQRDTGLVEAADEVVEAGLVVDGDEGPADGDSVDGKRAHDTLLRWLSGAPRRAMPLTFTPRWWSTCASRVRSA